MDQDNSYDLSFSGEMSDSLSGSYAFGPTSTVSNGQPDRFGMTDEEYKSYLDTRAETFDICQEYLALYTANPEFQLDF